MLCRKINLTKKAMTLQVVVGFALALTVFIVILIIASNKIAQSNSFGKDCIASGGACVEVSKCGACNTYVSCKMMFSQECNKNEVSKLICCPTSEVNKNE
jgi:hypothetical protein